MSVTREDIEKKTEELVELIKNFEGSKGDAALHVCFEVTTWACDTHFEGVGILTEALFMWRNRSIEVLDEQGEKESEESDPNNN